MVIRANLQEGSSTRVKFHIASFFAEVFRHSPVIPPCWPKSECALSAGCLISLLGRRSARFGGEHGRSATCNSRKEAIYGQNFGFSGFRGLVCRPGVPGSAARAASPKTERRAAQPYSHSWPVCSQRRARHRLPPNRLLLPHF